MNEGVMCDLCSCLNENASEKDHNSNSFDYEESSVWIWRQRQLQSQRRQQTGWHSFIVYLLVYIKNDLLMLFTSLFIFFLSRIRLLDMIVRSFGSLHITYSSVQSQSAIWRYYPCPLVNSHVFVFSQLKTVIKMNWNAV